MATEPLLPRARLFVALWPDEAMRAALAACRDACAWPPGAAPTATAKLHLTLHFIGGVDAGRVEAIADAVCGAPVAAPRFELELAVAECWRGGVAVLRPAAVPAALAERHAEIGQALQRARVPLEARRFRPHVTLARRAGPPRPLALPPAAPLSALPLRWPVAGHALVQSLPDGRYRVLARSR